MRDINAWAYHTDFGTLCSNAALDKASGLSYPAGNSQGQSGWHVAIPFEKLHDLATKLSDGIPMPRQYCGQFWADCDKVERGEIVRLAIIAHGDQGCKVAVDGKKTPLLTPDNIASFHADLHTIGLYTREQGSTILMMGCLAGQGAPGTRLLMQLSQIWPGRRVVGFSTIGYRHPGEMKRPGEACELPGMRDTDATDYLFAMNTRRFDQLWPDLLKLPWASDTSLHAKVVRNGTLEQCPQGELCGNPSAAPQPVRQQQKLHQPKGR